MSVALYHFGASKFIVENFPLILPFLTIDDDAFTIGLTAPSWSNEISK
jgi:hypothetical protein